VGPPSWSRHMRPRPTWPTSVARYLQRLVHSRVLKVWGSVHAVPLPATLVGINKPLGGREWRLRRNDPSSGGPARGWR